MKPPICYLCNTPISTKDMGSSTLVKFADYEPLPPDKIGHPHGLEWFCSQHIAAAQNLSSLKVAEAYAKLKQDFSEETPK